MENPSITKHKLVLIPFPFDDFDVKKVRPALCLTEPIGFYRHVILAFISSHLPDELLNSDLLINSDDNDFSITGLHVTSIIRLHRLMTAPTLLIVRELGELSPRMQREVSSKLKELFELKF